MGSCGEASWKNLAWAGNLSLQIPWELINCSLVLQGRVGHPGTRRRGCWETDLVVIIDIIVIIIIKGAGSGCGWGCCAERFLSPPSPLIILCQGQVVLGNSWCPSLRGQTDRQTGSSGVMLCPWGHILTTLQPPGPGDLPAAPGTSAPIRSPIQPHTAPGAGDKRDRRLAGAALALEGDHT